MCIISQYCLLLKLSGTVKNSSRQFLNFYKLVSSLKFVEEANIVFAKHAQVFHHIFQVGDTLDTQTECVAAIHAAVDAA